MTSGSAPTESGNASGPPCVGVLTVNYGSHQLLAHNLVPLTDADPALCAVVYDNFTTEHERAALRTLAAEHGWHLVESDTNDGFGAGTNGAAAVAIAQGATHLLLLNPDARMDAASVQALAVAVAQDEAAMAVPLLFDVSGRQRAPVRELRLSDGIITGPHFSGPVQHRPGHVPWLSGACLIVSVAMWQQIGGMAEEYFLYWEDVEFSFRALQHGARFSIVDGARCIHDQGGTQRPSGAADEPAPKSATYFFYAARSRLLFAVRNLDQEHQRAWRRSSAHTAWVVIRQAKGRRAAILHSGEAYRASARGIREGLRLRPSAGAAT